MWALIITTVIGLADYLLLYEIFFSTGGDYQVALGTLEKHHTIASEYLPSFALVMGVGFLGLFVIGLFEARKLSPLISAIATACMILAHVLGLIFEYHICFVSFSWVYMLFYLFHLNMMMLSISTVQHNLNEQAALIKEEKIVFKLSWMNKLYPQMCEIARLRNFYFLMVFPVAMVLELILILCGQGPDGIVKAFTMTADWKFSTQVPPPPR